MRRGLAFPSAGRCSSRATTERSEGVAKRDMRREHATHAEVASSKEGRSWARHGFADNRGARDSARSGGRPARRISEPQAALVVATGAGVPRLVNRQSVALVREEWRVVDRWWTDEPVHRRYFEVVLESGQNVVVFRDEERGGWFSQRGA